MRSNPPLLAAAGLSASSRPRLGLSDALRDSMVKSGVIDPEGNTVPLNDAFQGNYRLLMDGVAQRSHG
jgi:hypothetical protein